MKKILLSMVLVATALVAYAQDKYVVKSDIPYVEKTDSSAYRKERCKLDVYYPTDKKGSKTIVWFHGGGLEGGNKPVTIFTHGTVLAPAAALIKEDITKN